MSNNNLDLESSLHALKFVKPSENYFSNGAEAIRNNSTANSFWKTRLSLAVCSALILSVGLNLAQVVSRQSNLRGMTDPAFAANEAELSVSELQLVDVNDSSSIFRFLCLTKATVAINGSAKLGELKGFGEWAFFEIPANYEVTVSLLPLRDWNAIGQFEDGVISLELEAEQQIKLLDVGIGPSNIKRGGPFPVYGNIRQLSADADPAEPLGISNMVAGVDSELSTLTQKYFGALLSNDECG
ncbi:MAG: hypothetical protein DHS20C12_05540 [Pseudohongiella sp.]|nr:MAG: hypothetical protein DHS20C12_05540 [Pseudohongiella sp.]